MKLLVTFAVVLTSLVLLAAADRARFLPTGETYQDTGGERRLTVRSWSAVELRDGGETFRGTFETLVDGKVKVTLETPSGPRPLYFLRVEEGLREVEPDGGHGRLLYDRDHIGEAGPNRKKQRKTLVQIKKVGAAWFSWLTDQRSAAPAGSSMNTYDLGELTNVIGADDLLATLFPEYLQRVPATDGWGHDYEFYHADNVLLRQYMAIRSPGRDGAFDGLEYPIESFTQTDYDRDIVWADGFFIRYPGRPVE